MEKTYRLKSPQNFRFIFGRGRRAESAFFKAVFAKNDFNHGRFAFVVPKAVSKSAVMRNTLKRRAREWIRKNERVSCQSADLVLIFKKEAAGLSKNKFYEELEKILGKVFRARP